MFGRQKRKSESAGVTSGNPSTEDFRCSFCNKVSTDVRKLIAGPTVFICNECVDVCVEIMADDRRFESAQRSQTVSPPLAQDQVACSLCGKSGMRDEMLTIDNRWFLCGACADAVDDALARGTRISE